ncbi:MAG: beta-propeller fold lactonase family protein [Verrucomicrobiales bacterium]|nr:beta-propeller fold lactonase family protein [Verrucomicrobiales bacterium]
MITDQTLLMKPLCLFFTLLLFIAAHASTAPLSAAEPFTVYAPSRESNQIWEVRATPGKDGLALEAGKNIPLDFSPATITAHPLTKKLYVTSTRPVKNVSGGVTVDFTTGKAVIHPFAAENSYSYLSLDRKNQFLLGCNYGEGIVDVYSLDADGNPTARVATLNEGRKNAHCVLPTPDNRFIYIPYVKETNALYQYHFNEDTGALSALEKLNAEPPEGTGPRHLAYHPTLPIQYFSNEQQLGVSVYDRAEDGQLTIKQVCDLTGPTPPEDGVSSSDIVITADGRFLFAGIRGHKHDFDFISRYRILDDGTVKHLGLTPADKIPWGLALSPDGTYLLATGFEAGTLMAFSITEQGDLKRAGTFAWDAKISDLIAW